MLYQSQPVVDFDFERFGFSLIDHNAMLYEGAVTSPKNNLHSLNTTAIRKAWKNNKR
jgi:hypothetical protein